VILIGLQIVLWGQDVVDILDVVQLSDMSKAEVKCPEGKKVSSIVNQSPDIRSRGLVAICAGIKVHSPH
jgi:hypothetical protein